jgi:hypothetical protein
MAELGTQGEQAGNLTHAETATDQASNTIDWRQKIELLIHDSPSRPAPATTSCSLPAFRCKLDATPRERRGLELAPVVFHAPFVLDIPFQLLDAIGVIGTGLRDRQRRGIVRR